MTPGPLHRIDGKRGGQGRHYARMDLGRIVPSVTTVVSLTPKPYLLNWVVKLAADWAAEHAADLYQIPDVEERAALIKAETRVLREAGAKAGTALHEYAEMHVWLGPSDTPPQTRPEQAVHEIMDLLKPRVLYTEAMVWNGTEGYAGTIDGIWEVDNDGPETWLVDWKTSKSRSAEWALQQDAYKRAESIFDAEGREYPMPPIDRLMILWCPYAEPWSIFEVLSTNAEWDAFRSALRVLRWHESRGVREVYSEPLFSLSYDTNHYGRNHSMSTTDDMDWDEFIDGTFVRFDTIGASVSGTVVRVYRGTDFNGNPCPQIDLATADGDKTVTCGQANLKAQMVALKPKVGDTLTIRLDHEEKAAMGMRKVFVIEHGSPLAGLGATPISEPPY